MKNFVFLSGLPRTGSTLLSAILSQNPNIHAEGSSAVCTLMWDLFRSCKGPASEQLLANYKEDVEYDLISSIPQIYYRNIEKSIIVDKCRDWTIEANINLICKYITKNPKFIVMLRPIDEILKSWSKLFFDNGYSNPPLESMLMPGSEPLMRPIDGVVNAIDNHYKDCIFIWYDELIDNTNNTIKKIYNFLEWEYFDHNFLKIENKFPENDKVYNLIGQHDVRSTIKKRDYLDNIELHPDILKTCEKLNNLIKLNNKKFN